jgi:hypothetical protein
MAQFVFFKEPNVSIVITFPRNNRQMAHFYLQKGLFSRSFGLQPGQLNRSENPDIRSTHFAYLCLFKTRGISE